MNWLIFQRVITLTKPSLIASLELVSEAVHFVFVKRDGGWIKPDEVIVIQHAAGARHGNISAILFFCFHLIASQLETVGKDVRLGTL